MTNVAEALSLGRQGFHIFPLRRGSKLPAIEKFPARATTDAAKIERWAAKYPGCNWGLSTSSYGAGEALLVVDVDSAGHGAGTKDGPASLTRLERQGNGFPLTREHSTPTGGRHLLYRVPSAVRQGADVLGPGLDTRSKGGYIVAPGSIVEAGEYFVDRPGRPEPAPQWLIDACGAPRERASNRDALPGINADRARQRALAYLQHEAPEAIEGAGGDQTTFIVAAKLKDLGVSPEVAVDLMAEEWFDGCGWTAEELAIKVRNAFNYGQNPQGADAPEAQFEPIEDEANKGVHPLHALNREWVVVAEAPRVVVYRIDSDPDTGQRTYDAFSKPGFFDLYANRPFAKGQHVAQAWWEWKERRLCDRGVQFAPGVELPPSVLNVWGGFAKRPAPGDWSLLRAHIREVICRDDERLFQYVLNWLARMFQRPGEPGQVALVMRGPIGAGKGTLGDALLTLVGRHGIHLNNPEQLTGRFNGHLGDKILVFADEAVFAGDRQTASKLKAMLTEKRLPVERKGLDIVELRNCTHVLMASNEDWVIPAGKDERRFCVLDVSDARMRDYPYFEAIRAQMNVGGHEAMLHDLMARDLEAFNVWDYPHTSAEVQQQLASLDAFDMWFYDALGEGSIGPAQWDGDGLCIRKSEAYDAYKFTRRERNEYRVLGKEAFWTKVRAVLKKTGLALGQKQAHDGERYALFPPLTACRDAFAALVGRDVPWPT
jgi:hypothetical protein